MKSITIKASALFLLAVACLCNGVNAQNIQTYNGEMKVPSDLKNICSPWSFDYSSKKVMGEYKYYENEDEDRIWHGKFRLSSDRIGYKDQVLTGNYTHGKKDGEFVIGEVENGKPTGIGLVVNYKNGVLNGEYFCVTIPSLFVEQDSGAFKNGMIVGKIIWKKSASAFTRAVADTKVESIMEGVVGANGLPEGVWTITTTGEIPMVQKRYFHNGRLICIEERDKSTGERYLCYCVFEGVTKAPDMSLIRDTIVEGKEVVVYKGQSAMLVKDDSKINYNSKMEQNMLGHYGASAAIPEHLRALDSTVRKQAESWDYTYSSNAYKDYLAEVGRLKQMKQDSIRRVEKEREEVELLWQNYEVYNLSAKEELKYVGGIGRGRITIAKDKNYDFKISYSFDEENLRTKSGRVSQEVYDEMVKKYHFRIAATNDGKSFLFYPDDEDKIPELMVVEFYGKKIVYSLPPEIGKKMKL